MDFPGAHPMIQELMALFRQDGQGRLSLVSEGRAEVDAVLKKFGDKPGFNEAAWQLMSFAAFLDVARGSGDLSRTLIEALEVCAKRREAQGLETAAIERAKRIKDTFQSFQGHASRVKAPRVGERREIGVPVKDIIHNVHAANGPQRVERLHLTERNAEKAATRRRRFTVEG